jgi:hypothetical protein
VSGPNSLSVHIFNHPSEAPTFRPPDFLAATLDHANIVRRGTKNNLSTVDLVFVNKDGQKYVAMITGALVRSLAAMIGEED